MSFECIDIGEVIKNDVDERTRRLIGRYVQLQYELLSLTGYVHSDEDHTLDRSELPADERLYADTVARDLRAIRRLIGAQNLELLHEYDLATDHPE